MAGASCSTRPGDSPHNLYWQWTDGTGDAERLTEAKNSQWPVSWHPSGKFLASRSTLRLTGWDLMLLPMDGDEASGGSQERLTLP